MTNTNDAAPATMKIGDIIRYATGPTALMRIEQIIGFNHQLRAYGRQCMGGVAGAYLSDSKPASEIDLRTWAKHNPPNATDHRGDAQEKHNEH